MSNKKEAPINSNQESNPDSIDMSDGLMVEPKTKKKKKKKNKAGKNKAKTVFYGPSGELLSAPYKPQAEPLTDPDSVLLERATEVPESTLTLPVKPDEWFISPATYDRDGNQITEETFIYLKDGIDIVTIPFNENNFEGLAKLLRERFAPDESNTEADFFHIRTPFSEEEETNPVMTLTQKNRILATTSLDQKSLKRLIKALQKHVERSPTITSWLVRWWRKHKIWRVILTIASLPVILFLLYSIFWGVTHS